MADQNYGRVVTPETQMQQACTKCGHVTSSFDKFCPQCRAPLGRPAKKKSSFGRILLYAIIGFLIYMFIQLMSGPM